VLAFATAGMHDLLGLLLTVTLSVGSAVVFRLEHQARYAWLVAAAGAAIGFAVVYYALGNEVRITAVEHYGEPLRAVRIAAVQALQSFPDWVFDSRLLLATLLVLTHPTFYAIDVDWLRNDRVPWRLVVPGLWLVLMTGLLLGPAWGTGKWVASRVLAPLYMVFLLGWFATLLVLVRQHFGTTRPRLPDPRLWFALLLVFSMSLIVTGNSRRVINDLLDPLPKWQASLEQRAEQISTVAGQAIDVRIARTVELPYIIGFGELTDTPTTG
jgi:hypothetical protein